MIRTEAGQIRDGLAARSLTWTRTAAITTATWCTVVSGTGCNGEPDLVKTFPGAELENSEGWPDGADCHWPACAGLGKCAVGVAGACTVTTETCRKSASCREWGQCDVFEGLCDSISRPDRPCKLSSACDYAGWCDTLPNGQCRAVSNSSCVGSRACREQGLCRANGLHCVNLNSNDECRHSTGCRDHGQCSSNAWRDGDGEGYCEPASAADCASSVGCLTSGNCHFDAQARACVRPSELFDCSATEGCRVLGTCGTTKGFPQVCAPKNKAHCLKSTACKSAKRCEYLWLAGECVHPSAVYLD